MSCIESSGERFSIFRNRSFTLFRNERDFNDMSDSATVLESISSSSTKNLSVCSVNKPGGCSLTSLPVLRERSDSVTVSESISISMTNSLDTQASPYLFSTFHQISALEKTTCRHCSILRSLMIQPALRVSPYLFAAHLTSSEVLFDLQILCSPGFQTQLRQARSDSWHGISIPNSVIGFDFAVTLSSPASSCVLFDIALSLLVELKC